ncbi:MAG: hypothetical protein JNL57_04280 [Bacteroidetes bacterium]|nr:hypothetical protein [Bacteroidota bacterium]
MNTDTGESEEVKGSLNTEVRGICDAILSFNDLLKKDPNREAYIGYADLLENKLGRVRDLGEDIYGKYPEFTKAMRSVDGLVKELRSTDAKSRETAHKTLWELQQKWVNEFGLK